ncbi:MAG: hypothetical protein OXH76_20235 [Boseongicola sp.]|nr:hypothetical protein [Boseongicola sp.]
MLAGQVHGVLPPFHAFARACWVEAGVVQMARRLMLGWIPDGPHDPAWDILFLGDAFPVDRHLRGAGLGRGWDLSFSLCGLAIARLACMCEPPSTLPVPGTARKPLQGMETARVFKTCKFRPRPTDDQAARLGQWLASVRWLCNAALEQRETDGRRKGTDLHGRPTNFKGCGKDTDDVIIQDSEIGWRILAKDPDLAWLTDLLAQCRRIAFQGPGKAFDGFFKGRGGCSASRSNADGVEPPSMLGRPVAGERRPGPARVVSPVDRPRKAATRESGQAKPPAATRSR